MDCGTFSEHTDTVRTTTVALLFSPAMFARLKMLVDSATGTRSRTRSRRRGTTQGGQGFNVAQHGYAVIIGNTIQRNPIVGILVHEGSSARIGVQNPARVQPSGQPSAPLLARSRRGHGFRASARPALRELRLHFSARGRD
jgi:hypothetical protein